MIENENLVRVIEKNLKDHVVVLSNDIGERGYHHHQNLEKAAEYIYAQFQSYGYVPEKQSYAIRGSEYSNIIATKKGAVDPDRIIIAGAHYDTVPETPGADDNASGVAGILELSRLLVKTETDKTMQFIAFVNEEPPFHKTNKMGSRVFALDARKKKENIIAMFSFEMIGYFSENKRSQHHPFGIRLSYPDRANFIAIVGDLSSSKLVREVARIFRKHSPLDIESINLPRFIPGVDFSDHWSFWKEGYRAAMITDTAFYRYSDYHTPLDTFEKLDYRSMAQVVEGFFHVFKELT